MRMIKGIFYILLFYFIGELISVLIYGFIPGCIIGMLLLFAFLQLGVVKSTDVEDVANAFTKNMAVFFIPAGAGLLKASDVLSKFWLSILIVCAVSSVLVIAAVALMQERLEHREAKKISKNKNEYKQQ